MKIYHKFLLYQNKLLKPYVRILLGLVEALTYLASLLLIVGVVYEHGFPLSPVEVQQIQILYKAVWIIFLIDVTLHISLEYRKMYAKCINIIAVRRLYALTDWKKRSELRHISISRTKVSARSVLIN